ncbi:hypothetical protein CB1_000436034 [Camelus ferus]|nr:hypothetical protein CB1_000436034 [Camelus ferus]
MRNRPRGRETLQQAKETEARGGKSVIIPAGKYEGSGALVVARHLTVVLIKQQEDNRQITSGKVLPRVRNLTATWAGCLRGDHAHLLTLRFQTVGPWDCWSPERYLIEVGATLGVRKGAECRADTEQSVFATAFTEGPCLFLQILKTVRRGAARLQQACRGPGAPARGEPPEGDEQRPQGKQAGATTASGFHKSAQQTKFILYLQIPQSELREKHHSTPQGHEDKGQSVCALSPWPGTANGPGTGDSRRLGCCVNNRLRNQSKSLTFSGFCCRDAIRKWNTLIIPSPPKQERLKGFRY